MIVSGRTGENTKSIRENWPFGSDVFRINKELEPDNIEDLDFVGREEILKRESERV